MLDSLTGRERRVLQLRFGLEDGRARTLEEVGKEFNVTRERIRQIEAKALRKLRHPSRSAASSRTTWSRDRPGARRFPGGRFPGPGGIRPSTRHRMAGPRPAIASDASTGGAGRRSRLEHGI